VSGFCRINKNPTSGKNLLLNGQVSVLISRATGYIAKNLKISMNNLQHTRFARQHWLGYAFIASVLLHVSLIVGLSASPLIHPFDGTVKSTPDFRVEIQRPATARQALAPEPIPKPVAPTDATPLPRQRESLEVSEVIPARFIVEPDLDGLRDIPVTLSGRIHFRLHVSSIGTVGAVEVVEHDPVPLDLMNELKSSLAQARLHPAEQKGHSVNSTLDITVRFEPVTMP